MTYDESKSIKEMLEANDVPYILKRARWISELAKMHLAKTRKHEKASR